MLAVTFDLPLIYVTAGLVLLGALAGFHALIRAAKTVTETGKTQKDVKEALALNKEKCMEIHQGVQQLAAWQKLEDEQSERREQEVDRLTSKLELREQEIDRLINKLAATENELEEVKQAEIERLFSMPWKNAYEQVRAQPLYEDALKWFKEWIKLQSPLRLPTLSGEAVQKFMGELVEHCHHPGSRPYDIVLALFPKPKPKRDLKEQKRKLYLEELGRYIELIDGCLLGVKHTIDTVGIGGHADNAVNEMDVAERRIGDARRAIQDMEDLERSKV